MSLPRIDVPSYTCTLPSSGQQLQYRPFLVKEQKQLLIALGGDEHQQMQTVKNVVAVCFADNDLNVEQLSAYDIEYLFMQLRIRSVGETVDLVLTCAECGNKQDSVLDLQTVKVNKPKNHVHDLELVQDLVIKLRDPNMHEVAAIKQATTVDDIIVIIASCITGIWKNDELFDVRDYSLQQLVEFVENLSPAHLEKFNEFFKTLPSLTHTLDYTCTKCEANNTAVLEGLQSFFV
jgi:ribosomal protein L44E